MKSVTASEATTALEQASKTQREIVAQGAHEYLPFIWWGLFILFGYPPFDYLNGNIWGPIIGVSWIIGMYLTYRYFKQKESRVHTFRQKSVKASIALGILTFVAITLAEVLQFHYKYTWTVIGVILASLYLGYGLKLRATSK